MNAEPTSIAEAAENTTTFALELPPAPKEQAAWLTWLKASWGWVALIAAVAVFGSTTPGFLSVTNAVAIVSSAAFIGILAVGTAIIMLSGSLFNLSVGTTAAVTSMTFLLVAPLGFVPALAVTLLTGIVVFGVQGLLVGYLGANPIIVTIGAGALQTGLVTWLLPGSVQMPADVDVSLLTQTFFGLPFAVYVFVIVTIVGQLVLKYTTFGRSVELVGEHSPAARAAGLPTGRTITLAFVLAGLCTAITGVLLAGFNQNANLAVSGSFTFEAIAAAIVGGNAVSGGKGSAVRAALGACIIAVIGNALLLRGYSTGIRTLVEGLIVIVVVIVTQSRKPGVA